MPPIDSKLGHGKIEGPDDAIGGKCKLSPELDKFRTECDVMSLQEAIEKKAAMYHFYYASGESNNPSLSDTTTGDGSAELERVRPLDPIVLVGGVDAQAFKSYAKPRAKFVNAAKLVQHYVKYLDPATRTWYDRVSKAVDAFASFGTYSRSRKADWNKLVAAHGEELIFGADGTFQFLLGFDRILNVHPALKNFDESQLDEGSMKIVCGSARGRKFRYAYKGVKEKVGESIPEKERNRKEDTAHITPRGTIPVAKPALPETRPEPAAPEAESVTPGEPGTVTPDAKPDTSNVTPRGPESEDRIKPAVPDAKPEGAVPDARPESKVPDAKPEGDVPDARPESKVPDAKPESKIPDAKPEGKVPDARPESKVPEAKPESKIPEAKPESKIPEAKPEGKVPEAKPESKIPEAKPEGKVPEAKPESKIPDAKPESKIPEAKPESKIPEAKPESKIPEAKPEGAVPDARPESKVPDAKPENDGMIASTKKWFKDILGIS